MASMTISILGFPTVGQFTNVGRQRIDSLTLIIVLLDKDDKMQ